MKVLPLVHHAIHPDLAAAQLQDPVNNRQPQPQASPAAAGAAALVVFIKDMGADLLRHADARISDRDLQLLRADLECAQ